jgi:hypothetical protein
MFFRMRTVRGVLTLILVCSSMTAVRAQTATARIVSAANTFLSTLDEKQRQKVLFAFNDEKQRANWSNFPTSFVPRAGVSLKELNTAQRSAALALVSSALSRRGFENYFDGPKPDPTLPFETKSISHIKLSRS